MVSFVFLIGILFNTLKFIQAWKALSWSDDHKVNIILIKQMKTHSIGALWDFIFMLVFLS